MLFNRFICLFPAAYYLSDIMEMVNYYLGIRKECVHTTMVLPQHINDHKGHLTSFQAFDTV